MAHLKIYSNTSQDVTAISNRFIDEYMKDANDAQLKVYLYLLRMLGCGQVTSVSDMADFFNHTEKDIVRALKYWEKHSLIALDYDSFGNLTGIRLNELSSTRRPGNGQITVSGPAGVIPTGIVPTGIIPGENTMPEDRITNISSIRHPVFESSPNPFIKPAYSSAELSDFKQKKETKELLDVCEQYMGRPLSRHEITSVFYINDVLGFSFELIGYLIEYCIELDKKDFKYIEKVAVNWAEEGITNRRQAVKYTQKRNSSVYSIMNELGRSNKPTPKEMEYINRWSKEYGFSLDIILEACGRCALATDKHRFEYAEGILANWKAANVTKKSDIDKIDEEHSRKKETVARPQSPRASYPSNKFNQFPQNDYDFDALEKELLRN
ncbi:MAG: DnaD domain protein [Lachnospiraceae bacterium]|nr:DnaD domain protein [Lachnospiraceae bacterium]